MHGLILSENPKTHTPKRCVTAWLAYTYIEYAYILQGHDKEATRVQFFPAYIQHMIFGVYVYKADFE